MWALHEVKQKSQTLNANLKLIFDENQDSVNGVDIVVIPDAKMKLPETNNPPRLPKENPHRLKNSNSTAEAVAAASAITEETLASVLKSDDKCFSRCITRRYKQGGHPKNIIICCKKYSHVHYARYHGTLSLRIWTCQLYR